MEIKIEKQCKSCLSCLAASLDFFYKEKKASDGLSGTCKECVKKRSRIWSENNKECKAIADKLYAERNKDKISEYQLAYRLKNKVQAAEYSITYREKNKDNLLKKRKDYFSRPDVRKRRSENDKERARKDIKFAITRRMSSAISSASRGKYGSLRHVEWTVVEFIAHIEKQFTKGMSWDNYGDWHIDHIVPIKLFNYTSPEDKDFLSCWSLSNLRPLWASENCSKQAKRTHLI